MLQQYKRVLVAIDGSDESELAFKKAVNVTKRNQGELLLLHVIDTRAFQSISSYDSLMAEQATEMAKQTLEGYVKYSKEQGVDSVSYIIEYGAPKPVIAKQIPSDHQIDLIMIGATGLTAVERLFIGSVTEYVVRNARCDVLVVRTNLENKLSVEEEATDNFSN